jgi:hypothetical protein
MTLNGSSPVRILLANGNPRRIVDTANISHCALQSTRSRPLASPRRSPTPSRASPPSAFSTSPDPLWVPMPAGRSRTDWPRMRVSRSFTWDRITCRMTYALRIRHSQQSRNGQLTALTRACTHLHRQPRTEIGIDLLRPGGQCHPQSTSLALDSENPRPFR